MLCTKVISPVVSTALFHFTENTLFYSTEKLQAILLKDYLLLFEFVNRDRTNMHLALCPPSEETAEEASIK